MPLRWPPAETATGTSTAAASTATISAIGAENEYASVIAQVGGQYMHAESIMGNPNTDPHTFEAKVSTTKLCGRTVTG
jgi:zinc/manganese transport system substrate-binding protein